MINLLETLKRIDADGMLTNEPEVEVVDGRLVKADWSFQEIVNVKFVNCEIVESNFAYTVFNKVVFEDCLIEDSIFLHSRIYNSSFIDGQVIMNSFAGSLWDNVVVSSDFQMNGFTNLEAKRVKGLEVKTSNDKLGRRLVYDVMSDRVYHPLFCGSRRDVFELLRISTKHIDDSYRESLRHQVKTINE